MKLLLAIALVLISNNLFAATPTYFQKIVTIYQTATAPTQADIEGIWTGREYRANNPNEAIGEFLGCISYSSGVMHGPLFDNDFFGCYNDGLYQRPASIIDEATYADLLETVTHKINEINYPAITFNQTEACYKLPWPYPGQECYRVSGGYIFYVGTQTINDKTEIVRAGYFYRKVGAPASSGNSL